MLVFLHSVKAKFGEKHHPSKTVTLWPDEAFITTSTDSAPHQKVVCMHLFPLVITSLCRQLWSQGRNHFEVAGVTVHPLSVQ